MKYALVDNNRIEATKGAKGVCPICGSELIAKCGEILINHWAHRGSRNCDPWWENETEWHRSWKDNFPKEWQEIILTDEITGEKHIADIRRSDNLVIEFQHSYIDPIERAKREGFYKKMIWVIDGTRLKRDYPRFLKAKESFRLTKTKGHFIVDHPNKAFPSAWIDSSVLVVFDFKGDEKINYINDWRYPLYYLLPKSEYGISRSVFVSRNDFIKGIINGQLFK